MDRAAGSPSFFMLCAVCVQIEYYNMEIIDAVDKIVTIYGTAKTQCYHIETVDVDYEDLKSPGSNTVWVRPPPALPDLRDQTRRFLYY